MKNRRSNITRTALTAALLIASTLLGPATIARAQEPGGPDEVEIGDGEDAAELAPPPTEGWGIAPAGPDGKGERAAFAYNLAPGQVLRDSVVITNLSDEPLHVDLYARDAFNTSEDGAFALQAVDEDPDAVGSWVTIGFEDVEIPAETARIVNFEISVPEDASPGDHAGGIIAENRDVLESVDEAGMPVDVRQRVGARIYIRVDGELRPGLQVNEIDLSSTTPLLPFVQGRTTVTYEVENVGNTRIVAASELAVRGLFGRTLHRFPAEDLPELLPGGSVRITREFDGVPPVERLSADLTLTAIDGSTAESASTTAFAWAWATPILIVLVAAGVLGRRALRSRDAAAGSRPSGDSDDDADATDDDGEPSPSDPEDAEASEEVGSR